MPDWVLKETWNKYYRYTWNGPSRIERHKASKSWEEGGINLPTIQEWHAASMIHWVRRMVEHSDRLWAKNMSLEISKSPYSIGSNPTEPDIPEMRRKGIGEHTIAIIKAWQTLSKGKNPRSPKTGIWLNKAVISIAQGKRKGQKLKSTLHCKALSEMGYNRIMDFFDVDGRLIHGRAAITKGIPVVLQAQWQKVIRALLPLKLNRTDIKEAKKKKKAKTQT